MMRSNYFTDMECMIRKNCGHLFLAFFKFGENIEFRSEMLVAPLLKYFDCNFGDICDAVKIEEIEKKTGGSVMRELVLPHGICARYLLENVWNGI